MDNIFIMEHPLIQHKISQLRDIHTGTNEFRQCIEEIAMLMGYEALRDLPLEDVEVQTPIVFGIIFGYLYFVPNILSPASPNPGQIYACSFRQRSICPT